MTNNSFEDAFLGKGLLEKASGWWELVYIVCVPEAIGYHSGWHNDRRITLEFLVVYLLKAFVTLERRMIFVSFKSQRRLSPQASQKVEFGTFFKKAIMVVPNLVFVEVAFN
jgi:hypothetical protein